MKILLTFLMTLLLSSCDGGYGYQGTGYGEGCFLAGALVSAPGQAVAIESIKAGDRVYAWDRENNRVTVGVVDSVRERQVNDWLEIQLSNGRVLNVTAEHPFFTSDWVPAGELRVGDLVSVLSSELALETATITAMASRSNPEPVTVYNMKVREFMNSFTDSALVRFYE